MVRYLKAVEQTICELEEEEEEEKEKEESLDGIPSLLERLRDSLRFCHRAYKKLRNLDTHEEEEEIPGCDHLFEAHVQSHRWFIDDEIQIDAIKRQEPNSHPLAQ